MSVFYVSAVYPQQWATVHRGECFHSRRGREAAKTGRNDKTGDKTKAIDWFGPFPTPEAAIAQATAQTGLRTISTCRVCKPA